MTDSGVTSNISTTLIFVMHSALHCLIIRSCLGSSFKKIKAKCYSDHKSGFYVYAKPNKCDPKNVIKYIGRYLGRPVIATSRIDKYDGETRYLSLQPDMKTKNMW